MSGSIPVVLYVAVMVAVIVGVDLAFFRTNAHRRLMANVGIVLAFAVVYLIFLRHR